MITTTAAGPARSKHRIPPWGWTPAGAASFFTDVPVVLAGLGLFYGLLAFGHYWMGPVNTQAEIELSPLALPKYALFSLARLAIAYILSFAFTLVYGYVAAYNAKAERILIPLLDTLQSIPVLSFLPGVMLSMMALFPRWQLGVELGSIVLIFTGQVWNMTFSFYSSLKGIPQELREAAKVYEFSWWQRLRQLEMPYAAIGLIWNSMMSVAGGWFFLMACEMFVLGNRDLRLPGLGSYLQTAANAGNTRAIVWGVATMIGVIVLLDQLVWRPVIAWGERFKFEQVEAAETPRSPVLSLLHRSELLSLVKRWPLAPARERMDLYWARKQLLAPASVRRTPGPRWTGRALAALALAGIAYGTVKMALMIAAISSAELGHILRGAGATLLRVAVTLALAAAWTVPVGVFIGLRPRVSAVLQPLAQIAASVPATALFPILLLVLIRLGGGLGIGSIALLLLGTQWYLLFNVIAGASAIPADLKEVSTVFRFSRSERWWKLFLPAIFPYLVTGLVTASGGAWNASIVAEYFHFKGQTLSTVGLGSLISQATDSGNFPLLIASTVVMAAMVVTINRLLWRRLYALAATRFNLEA
jgi:NitT/TauT family transport system permease protein